MGVDRFFSIPYRQCMIDFIQDLCVHDKYMLENATFKRDLNNSLKFEITGGKYLCSVHMYEIIPSKKLISLWDGSRYKWGHDDPYAIKVKNFFHQHFKCGQDIEIYSEHTDQEDFCLQKKGEDVEEYLIKPKYK